MDCGWYKTANRLPDWRERLNGTFISWADEKFVWGSTDCFCFAAACIEAVTGENPMLGFIGSYESKKQAYRSLLKGIEGSDGRVYRAEGIEGYIRLFMGQEKPVLTAQRGDIVLIQQNDMQVTSVVDDSGLRLVAMTESDGLVRLPLKVGTMAWSV